MNDHAKFVGDIDALHPRQSVAHVRLSHILDTLVSPSGLASVERGYHVALRHNIILIGRGEIFRPVLLYYLPILLARTTDLL